MFADSTRGRARRVQFAGGEREREKRSTKFREEEEDEVVVSHERGGGYQTGAILTGLR